MKDQNKKAIAAILAIIILATAVIAVCGCKCKEELGIYKNTLRLHIIADSDSDEDQALKLTVRDAVLSYLSAEINKCESKSEAEALISSKSAEITELAQGVVYENGFDYGVKLTITEEFYPERTYDEITLPAGKYSSVQIKLGESEGQNWWCVLFPQVCTDTATPSSEKLADAGFTANQIRLLTDEERTQYKVKFKLLELLSALL